MIMGTYANLYLTDPGNDVEMQNWKPVDQDIVKVPIDAQMKQISQKVDLPSKCKCYQCTVVLLVSATLHVSEPVDFCNLRSSAKKKITTVDEILYFSRESHISSGIVNKVSKFLLVKSHLFCRHLFLEGSANS